ncbi:hypothetical protein HPB50_010712 [Hyalomma asiaticum]|uniref:Uncharacterized protein n=1 Tax=Hyalomma asiaticum TaxID=266040 RepID=A0ACB7SG76_HYAAI|nr:hypothetical protein HPB50_010712 [Hyalomma asiaticum]
MGENHRSRSPYTKACACPSRRAPDGYPGRRVDRSRDRQACTCVREEVTKGTGRTFLRTGHLQPHVDDSAVTVRRRRRRHGRNATDQRRSSALRCEHSAPTTTYKPNCATGMRLPEAPSAAVHSRLSPTALLRFTDMADRWRRAPARLRRRFGLVGPSPPIPMKRERREGCRSPTNKFLHRYREKIRRLPSLHLCGGDRHPRNRSPT